MDSREHIEFVQSQLLPWQRIGAGLARPDAEYKILSRDPETGACTALMRYPVGWSRMGPEHIVADEEFFVLDGSLEMDGELYEADSYAFLPAGWTRNSMSSKNGCVLIAFYNREPVLVGDIGDCDTARAISHLKTRQMAWDMTLNDSNLRHLGISRKDLRTDPESGERTFLSLILPQSEPPSGEGPQESHPVVEECYMIAGSLAGPPGTMHPGAYFWRPPAIPHGPYGSRWGAVSLIRFVGGKHENVWSKNEADFSFDQAYDPVLPERLEHLRYSSWQGPLPF
ncbi:cupin domain-containing protein [Erythrobacter sp. JK5]|uniref:cupin domain-containing protein n=1 Tax=Erythrobacter sp. JK5 TaxID=2829500 RepID=UPI001BA7C46C|nr:DUF4437 domain-containing protein [Erythrobacter sp. JK5]QUL39042.1 cupin domain-containing protein [Erythrobacter sp. JK5]